MKPTAFNYEDYLRLEKEHEELKAKYKRCKNKGSNKCRSCHDDPLTLPEYEWRGVQDA